MSALLHSQVLQGVGRGPTPDSAANKSVFPKIYKLKKKKSLCRSQGLSFSPVGIPHAQGWCLVSAVTHGSHWLLLVPLQSKDGLCAPQSPCGFLQNWQREELPLGCSKLPALTEPTELEGNVWHTLPSPGISFCLREFKHLWWSSLSLPTNDHD